MPERKKLQEETKMGSSSKLYLPEDIIREILLKLPAKSLLRFQAVCKCWSAVIKRNDFIGSHHQHRPKQSVMLCKYDSKKSKYGISLFVDASTKLDDRNIIPSKLSKKSSLDIVGSSRGLLCLQVADYERDDYFLWNPATRECLRLPSSQSRHKSASGFGFHLGINDHKLVRVFLKHVDYNFTLKAEVFAPRTTGSSWRQVKDISICRHPDLGKNNTVAVNGVCYFMGFDVARWANGSPFILMFDMGNDGCSRMKAALPSIYNNTEFEMKLVEYKESLAMMVHGKNKSYSKLEIWRMENHHDPWTKLITCERPLPATMSPSGIRNDEEVIIREDNHHPYPSCYNYNYSFCRLHSFNLNTQQLRMLPKNNATWFDHKVHNYVESLFPVRTW